MKSKTACLSFLSFLLFASNVLAGTIQLPQSGQTKCYDTAGSEIPCEGTGQDADMQMGMPWPIPRFQITYCDVNAPCADQSVDCDGNSSTDVVTDKLTGLIWTRNGNHGYMNWNQAIDYSNNLTVCGYTDWQLPNKNELESIINSNAPITATWLNGQGFANVQDLYWSSTVLSFYPPYAWAAFLSWGYVNWDDGITNFNQNPLNINMDSDKTLMAVYYLDTEAIDFVYPILGISQTDPLQNKNNPLDDGWAGKGVGQYSADAGHLGQDYYLKSSQDSADKPVYAIANGEIVEVLNGAGKYGWCDNNDHGWGPVVVIKHYKSSGFKVSDSAIVDPQSCGTNRNPTVIYSLYGHLSKNSIKNLYKGQRVKKGDLIGTIGKSGVDFKKWNTNHLHFEIKDEKGFKEGSWYWYRKNWGKCPGSTAQSCKLVQDIHMQVVLRHTDMCLLFLLI